MRITQRILDKFKIDDPKQFRLAEHDPGWAGTADMKELGKKKLKKSAEKLLDENRRRLAEAQGRLYADDTYSLLVVFQAMDAAGKDGTIKHVMSGVNPQGCQVTSFKRPSKEELDHTYLWRCNKGLPERGRIGIFNRSYYEEVLVVKVHPQILESQQLPPGPRGKAFWKARYEDINNYEKHLDRNGTVVLKFFLNVSKEEQKERFMERLNNPDKNWKFSDADVRERGYWDDYMEAFEQAIRATSTSWAPWYVIPADKKWVTRALVAEIIADKLMSLGLDYPKLDAEALQGLESAREQLLREKD